MGKVGCADIKVPLKENKKLIKKKKAPLTVSERGFLCGGGDGVLSLFGGSGDIEPIGVLLLHLKAEFPSYVACFPE